MFKKTAQLARDGFPNEIGNSTANLPKVAVTGETITNYPPSGCGSHLSQHQGMNNLEGMALLWCKRAKNDLQDCRIADMKNKISK